MNTPETAKHTPQLAVYENRHGGFDLKAADSTLALPLASARTKELADTIALCVNSHDRLVKACEAAESALAAFLPHHPAGALLRDFLAQ